jgi:hypothetical protein
MKPEKNLQTDTNPDSNPDSNPDKLFNTEPLLNELNTVIQTGMKKLLGSYITNYKLYEETHNCIMNLPSVKREIAKKFEVDETYDDLPELISISSDEDSEEHDDCFKNYCNTGIKNIIYDNLNKPIKIITDFNDNKKESDIMLKLINDLLKEKKEVELFNKQQEETYKKIIETCDKEIEDLKNQINNCVKQSLDYNLTSDKQEKENIILHIEENSDLELDLESDEEESDEEEEDVEEDDKAESEEEEKAESEEEKVESEEEDVESEEEEKVESEEEEKEEEKAESEEEKVESEEEKTELSEDEVETEEEKDEDEEEELFEIEIDGVTYCTENEDNGFIYVLDKDGNVGETTGYLKNGEPFFN